MKKIHTTVAALLFATSICSSAGPDSTAQRFVSVSDEFAARKLISSEAKNAWDNGEFQKIDQLVAQYTVTKEKTSSGKWKLDIFDKALSAQLKIDWPDEWNQGRPIEADCPCRVPQPKMYAEADKRWETVHGKILMWIKMYPSSTYAQIVLAHYQSARGWFYRGAGYADTVPKEAWPKFHHYIHLAYLTLNQISWKGNPNPVWFESMANMATEDQLDSAHLEEFKQRLYKEGGSYIPAYHKLARKFLSQWGGTPEQLEQFVRDAMTHSSGGNDVELYTRIYWNLGNEIQGNMFENSKASWPLMRQGFDEIISRYPSYWNLIGKAKTACEAADPVTLRGTMKLLENKVSAEEMGEYLAESCTAYLHDVDRLESRKTGPWISNANVIKK